MVPTARRRNLVALLLTALLAACSAANGQTEAGGAPPARGAGDGRDAGRVEPERPPSSPAQPPAAVDPFSPAERAPRPPPPSPEPPRPPEPRSFTLAVSGDILPHTPVQQRAREHGATSGVEYDFRPMFAELKPVLEQADLALCHLETPLSPDNQNLSGFPQFNAPRELADAIADAGYDGCSTASNHSIDKGRDGVVATLGVLDAAGVRSAGTARSPEEADAVEVYEVADVPVAHLSYTYGLNGRPLPEDAPWLVNLIDAERILADAERARQEGAEFVVVSLHWGVEYQSTPSEDQRILADQLTASPDIDLIVGHHAHVVQPIERVADKVVVFGLGNLLSNQSASCCATATQDGMVAHVTVTEEVDGQDPGPLQVEEVSYTPTWVERPSYRVLAVQVPLADPALDSGRRAELQASLDRTRGVVGEDVASVRSAEQDAPTMAPAG